MQFRYIELLDISKLHLKEITCVTDIETTDFKITDIKATTTIETTTATADIISAIGLLGIAIPDTRMMTGTAATGADADRGACSITASYAWWCSP
jgi:hypothetical protein